eukprot:843591_1
MSTLKSTGSDEQWIRLFDTLSWINCRYMSILEKKGKLKLSNQPMFNIDLESSIIKFGKIKFAIESMIAFCCPEFIYLSELDLESLRLVFIEALVANYNHDIDTSIPPKYDNILKSLNQ